MKTSRGFILPAIGPLGYALIALAALALISGIVIAAKSYIEGVDARGFQRGKQQTEAIYAKRDNEQLQAALAEIDRLNAEVRAREQSHQAELARIDRDRLKEKTDAENQRKRDVAAARSGALRLRDPGRTATACPAQGSQGTSPAPVAAAGIRDGEAGTDLSPEAAGFLLGLVNEADDVVRQLARAQQVIVDQVRTCNGTP